MKEKTKNNFSRKKLLLLCISLFALVTLASLSVYSLISYTSLVEVGTKEEIGSVRDSQNPKLRTQEKNVRPSEKKIKVKKETTYYCIRGASSYKRIQKKYKNHWPKMKNHYIKHHYIKYKLIWYQKKGSWYLNTSGWQFTTKGYENNQNSAAKPVWIKKPCDVSRSKTTVTCPVVLFHGLLWKLKFSRFEGTFVKVLLDRKAISEAAISRQYMAKFLGVKKVNHTNTCLRDGKSPIQDVII